MTGPQPIAPKMNRFKSKFHFATRLVEALETESLRSAKVWFVMGVISLLLIFGGHAFGRFGLLIGFLLALSVNSLVYFYADMRLASLFPGKELEGQDPDGLLRQTRELARALQMKAPQIVLIDSSTPLAFSAGLLPQQSKIYVSTELIKRLEVDEVRIVLAYELYRLKTQQTQAATAASALVSMITFTARAIDSVLLFRWLTAMFSKNKPLLRNSGIRLGPMTLLVSPLVALLVRFSVSRKALLESDHQAGTITQTGNATVARTLWKLDSYAKTRPFPVNLAEAHLFTVSPLTRYPMWRFASAQPPIEARLKALTGYEPL